MTSSHSVDIRNIGFGWPEQPAVLKDFSLALSPGESLFIHGPSGSGKSTLLNLVAGILSPQSGEICLLDQPFSSMSAAGKDRFRSRHIGFIFQQFNLLPYLSVLENVQLPCRIRKERADKAGNLDEACAHYLKAFGLPESHWNRPVTRLSIGQQQRVAAARALIGQPEIIIADEPTSALDAGNRASFMEVLQQQCRQQGHTLMFVSHDPDLAQGFGRELHLKSTEAD